MRRIVPTSLPPTLILALGMIVLSAPAAHALDFGDGGYLRASYSTDTYYESVYGSLRQSTLDVDSETRDAWHYDENLRIGFSRALRPDLGLDFSVWGRHSTDDILQRDPGDAWMINEIHFKLTGNAFELGLGDLSAFYSNYTFNNSFFGVSTVLRPAPWLSVSVLGGTNRDARRDTYRRAFGGARIELKPSRSFLLAASYVHTEITELFPGSAVGDYTNDVWSLSSRLALMDERLVLSGEYALSGYVADRRLPDAGTRWGSAAWCALSFTPLRNELSLLLAYERVEPDFIGVMGTHSTDRETVSAGLRYTPSELLAATAYFRSFHDRVTDASPAPYRTDTMDPGVAVTVKPFFYDPDSAFKNLTIDLSASLFREQSDDAPATVADERLIGRLRVGDSRDATRWALTATLERYDDRTAADLDSTAGSLGAEFGYYKAADRYTLSADLLAEVRIERLRDPARGRLTDTGARVGAGAALTYLLFPDYPTRCAARYEGIFQERESSDDTYEHWLYVTVEQVVLRRGGVTGTVGLHGTLRDVSSPNPGLAYGERVFGIYMSLEF